VSDVSDYYGTMRTVSAREASRGFSALLDRVYFNAEEILIERDGSPVALITPPPLKDSVEDFNDWLMERGPSIATADDDMQDIIDETRELLTLPEPAWSS